MNLNDIVRQAFEKAFPGEDFSFVKVGPATDPTTGTAYTFGANTTVGYKGVMHFTGGVTYYFAKHFDDSGYITITDPSGTATSVLADKDWGNKTYKSYTPAADGWYTIDLRVSNGSGGIGPNKSPFNDKLNAGLAWTTNTVDGAAVTTCTDENYGEWHRFLNGDKDGDYLYTAIPEKGVYLGSVSEITSSGFTAGYTLNGAGNVTVHLDVATQEDFSDKVTFSQAEASSEESGAIAATGLLPQQSYYWRFRTTGESELTSATGTATTIGQPVLGAVTAAVVGQNATITANLTAAGLNNTLETTLTLKYGADSANLDQSVEMGKLSAAGSLQGELADLGYGVTYYYQVAASADANGRTISSGSEIASFTTLFNGVMYVAKGNAGAAKPYDTPAKAAANLPEAVALAADGAVIHVADGIYGVSYPMTLSCGVRIIGNDADPSRTMVSNTTESSNANKERRVFLLDHAEASLTGLTIAKGEAYERNGGNVNISSKGGTVSNCVIVAGKARDNGQAGGVYAAAGLVTHCRLIGNFSTSESAHWSYNRCGSAIFEGSARVENCLFGDVSQYVNCHLIGVKGTAVMRNCDIVNSRLSASSNDYGGHYPLLVNGGNVTIENVVIAGVTDAVGAVLGPVGSSNVLSHCALDVDVLPNDGCVRITPAAFADYANGDYTPAADSPLINAGVNYSPMEATDLAGKPRLAKKTIDIGCYEFPSKGGMILVVR